MHLFVNMLTHSYSERYVFFIFVLFFMFCFLLPPLLKFLNLGKIAFAKV